MGDAPQIEGFDMHEELGRGPTGAVYRATDGEGRTVAVKVLEQDVDKRLVRRFAQEAQIGKMLEHPDVSRVYESGQSGSTPWISLEFIDGYELTDVIRDRDCGVDDRVNILCRVAMALHTAHEVDVIHRDIKPSNIFVTKDGGVRVLDFGIAKLQQRVLTQAGKVVGTPGYISPEQSQALPLDHRTDVFSLGLLAYELLTGGRLAWLDDDMSQLLISRATEPPRPFKEAFPTDEFELDEASIGLLHDIVHKAIQQKPEDRYETMMDFAVALQAYLQKGAADESGAYTVPDLKPDPEAWQKRSVQFALELAESGDAPAPSEPIPQPAAPMAPEHRNNLFMVVTVAGVLALLVAIWALYLR